MARVFKGALVDTIVANYQGQSFEFDETESGKTFTLHLGKSLGNGLSAQVYIITGSEGLDIPNAQPGEPLVVKMAHSLAFHAKPDALSIKNGALIREFETHRILMDQASRLWADPAMQGKKDVWIEGRVPVCPIYRIVKTEQGVLLIKPLVQGKSLKEIFRDAGGDMQKVPAEMRRSARDILDLAQALRRTVEVPGSGRAPTRMFTADLKPDNYMWIGDPAQFARYGLKKAGFVFVEMTHFPWTPRYTYDEKNMSPEDYEKMFIDYVRAAGVDEPVATP